ncbi:MAG TPA: hypothetical protein VFO33_02405, partial [Casimicrobiaceae bacterium]|nr:hypothetical protein [Casimicrobiaceae bacterium]
MPALDPERVLPHPIRAGIPRRHPFNSSDIVMSRRLPQLLAATMLVTAASASAQDASSIPMRDFFKNPERA